MNDPLTLEFTVHLARKRRRSELQLGVAPAPQVLPAGRVPRLARFMALALKLDGLVRQGSVNTYAELARLGHVTRARMTQILNLIHLAPDIQEEILFLPRTERGRDPVLLRDVQPIAAILDWSEQRRRWRMLTSTRRSQSNRTGDA